MKTLKIILSVLLIAVTALFTVTHILHNGSGKKEAPVLSCPQKVLELSVKDGEEVLLSSVTATDAQDGDLTDSIRISGISKLISDNTAKVTYLVFDSDDNMASCERTVKYTDYQRPRFNITQPLIFASSENISLLDRLTATDVIDGDITSSIRVSTLEPTNDPNVRTVTVQVTNSMGDTARLSIPIMIRETNPSAPVITLSSNLLYISKGSAFDPMQYIASVVSPEGELSADNVTVDGSVNTAEAGTYNVYYKCTYGGHSTSCVLTVVVQ